MNKYQEALEYLTEEAHSNYFRKYVQTSKEKAFLFKSAKALQELVELATPKKPKSEKEIFYLCPICKEFVGDEFDKSNYCSACGQAIDWSE